MVWNFVQLFKNNAVDIEPSSKYNDNNIITSLKFNSNGEILCIGDCGGRISLLKRKSGSKRKLGEYKHYGSFQSHEPSFDFLKSEEIDERINFVEFLSSYGMNNQILVANDRFIHLWKIYEKNILAPSNDTKGKLPSLYNNKQRQSKDLLTIPKLKSTGKSEVKHSLRKTYGKHSFAINSLSMSPDKEIFLSADDLRINLNHLNHENDPVTIVDIKPASMESLNEVITSASFHPEKDSLIVFSSSKAKTNLCDLRCGSSQIHKNALVFKLENNAEEKTVFTEIARSVSDTKIIPRSSFIVSRDYLNVLVWDIRMQREPLKVIPVNSSLEYRLQDLYQEDYIFDKFQIQYSPNGESILTGSYGKHFLVSDLNGNNFEDCIAKSSTLKRQKKKKLKSNGSMDTIRDKSLQNKITSCSWHPYENLIALSSLNSVYVMKEKKKGAYN